MFSATKGGSPSGYQISRSVRLRSSASAYFNRTFSTPTDAKKWTFNRWVKRGSLGARQSLFSAGSSGTSYAHIEFKSDDTIQILSENSATQFQLVTTQVFRDPSAWYNLHIIYDCANATSSDRLQLWINGVRVTAFSTATYPSTTPNNLFNTAIAHQIGVFGNGFIAYFDGYQTELNFIDGQALTPSSFGQYNAYGVWSPTKYNGTYGTNGFYLNFSDNSAATAAAIGKDYSGNGNNWTPNNISVTAGVTYDSMLDVPTQWADGGNGRGNYAVLNPLDKTSTITAADGNLGLTLPANVAGGCGSTIAVSSGQWYAEVTPTSGSNALIGIVLDNLSQNAANSLFSTGYGYYQFNGNKYVNGAASAYGASYAANNVIGIALDFTSLTLTFYKNNVSQGAISIAAGSYKLTISNGSSTVAQVSAWNFGQRPFSYTPPSGFKALNTQNLPDSLVKKGNQYFDVLTWSGTGGSSRTLSGLAFAPDLVWGKPRSAADWHNILDTSRGANLRLSSNTTNAEDSNSVQGYLSAFTSDGYTVTAGSTNFANWNASGTTYVGWQWQAGQGTTSNITVGQYSTGPNVPSIASTVSVNMTAGFSVVTASASGTSPVTIGHGLGVAPSFIIGRVRNNTANWYVYSSSFSSQDYLVLNGTAAKATSSNIWDSAPTLNVFTVGNPQNGWNGGTAGSYNYVFYCWAEVAGFSKFGTWQNNNSTDGTFIYLGFRPRFILLKNYDNVEGWFIWDSARQTYNMPPPSNNWLNPNLSNAEGANNATTAEIDGLSNGFKIRTTNPATGEVSFGTRNYIYAAFAENPFKYSLAR